MHSLENLPISIIIESIVTSPRTRDSSNFRSCSDCDDVRSIASSALYPAAPDLEVHGPGPVQKKSLTYHIPQARLSGCTEDAPGLPAVVETAQEGVREEGNIGASIITYTILGAPYTYHNYSIVV